MPRWLGPFWLRVDFLTRLLRFVLVPYIHGTSGVLTRSRSTEAFLNRPGIRPSETPNRPLSSSPTFIDIKKDRISYIPGDAQLSQVKVLRRSCLTLMHSRFFASLGTSSSTRVDALSLLEGLGIEMRINRHIPVFVDNAREAWCSYLRARYPRSFAKWQWCDRSYCFIFESLG